MSNVTELERSRADLVEVAPMPFNAEAPPAALRDHITPVGKHYVRSNFALPDHDGKLHIGGAVASPTVLTLDQLRALPAKTITMTMECAGNGRLDMKPLPIGEPWGGYAVSTARWTDAGGGKSMSATHMAIPSSAFTPKVASIMSHFEQWVPRRSMMRSKSMKTPLSVGRSLKRNAPGRKRRRAFPPA